MVEDGSHRALSFRTRSISQRPSAIGAGASYGSRPCQEAARVHKGHDLPVIGQFVESAHPLAQQTDNRDGVRVALHRGLTDFRAEYEQVRKGTCAAWQALGKVPEAQQATHRRRLMRLPNCGGFLAGF